MSKPIVPSLTERRKELASQIVPDDELVQIYEQYKLVLTKFIQASDIITPENIDDPPQAKELDALVREAVVILANAGITGSLSKLAWVSFSVFDPDYAMDWHDPKNIPAACLHRRIHQTSFYLNQFRSLKDYNPRGSNFVTMNDPSTGRSVQRERVFPMWGEEFKHKLDNHGKAKAWYREQLVERQVVK